MEDVKQLKLIKIIKIKIKQLCMYFIYQAVISFFLVDGLSLKFLLRDHELGSKITISRQSWVS